MKYVLAGLVFLAGLAAAAYVGIWVFLIGGVEDIVNGVKATPTDGGEIAWGVAKVFVLSELTGGLIMLVTFLVAAAIGGSDSVFGRRRSSFRRSRRSSLL